MDENEVFENYHYIMVKRLRMIVCIWPYQNKTLKFYGRTFIVFAIFSMMIPQLKHLYETITKDYKQIQEPREKAAMDELRDFARTLTIIYASYFFATVIFFTFTPQVVPAILDAIWPLNESRHKMIYYCAEYFIDQDEYLHILVFHTFVVVAITITIIVAVDTSFIAVTYHVLGLFNVLTCRLKRLSEWGDDNVNHENERLHNFIIDTIKIHNKTLDFAELVRTTYDVCNFIVVVATLLALSIGTIDVVMNITKPAVIVRLGFCFVGVVMNLFFVDWPGQKFIDSSNDLEKSIYFCNWYKLPKRTQFLLKFMMMRCRKPCQLTAGPLCQMNLAFCGSVLRTALSYFTATYSLS